MQIRIHTFPPLPKASRGFEVTKPMVTVQDLKEQLCTRIPAFEKAGIQPKQFKVYLVEDGQAEECKKGGRTATVLKPNCTIYLKGIEEDKKKTTRATNSGPSKENAVAGSSKRKRSVEENQEAQRSAERAAKKRKKAAIEVRRIYEESPEDRELRKGVLAQLAASMARRGPNAVITHAIPAYILDSFLQYDLIMHRLKDTLAETKFREEDPEIAEFIDSDLDELREHADIMAKLGSLASGGRSPLLAGL